MQFFRNLKLRSKLLVLNVTAVVFLLGISALSFVHINQMAENSRSMYEENLVKVQSINQVVTNFNRILNDLLQLMLTTDMDRNVALKQNFKNTFNENSSLLQAYAAMRMDAEEKKLFDNLSDARTTLLDLENQVVDLADDNRNDEAYALYTSKLEPQKDATEKLFLELASYVEKQAELSHDDNMATAASAKVISASSILAAILLLTFLALLITRSITRPLHELQALMEQAAEGDFTKLGTHTAKNETGALTRSYNAMVGALSTLVRQISENAVTLAASSQQLLASSEQSARATEHISDQIQDISEGAEMQASGAIEMSRTVEEMSMGIQRIAESASELAAYSQESETHVAKGREKVGQAGNEMEQIRQSIGNLADVVTSLNDKSASIGEITQAIKAIADQTSLLSLNAAIEAARAGEEGRGFAVVAAEVKKLAEQTQESSDSVSELIQQIQAETQVAFRSMEVSRAQAESGRVVMNDVSEVFDGIMHNTRNLSVQLHEVSAVTEQMSASSEEVLATVESSSAISGSSKDKAQSAAAATQEQLASVQEVTGSAAYLSKLAQDLQTSIERFKV